MDTGLSISISGIKDCPDFAIFDIDGGWSVGSCFDKVGAIAKAVENVVKRGDEITKDNILNEIHEQTDNKYSPCGDDDDFFYGVDEEEKESCNEIAYYYAWIDIDDQKNIKVGQRIRVYPIDEYHGSFGDIEDLDPVPEIISSHMIDEDFWESSLKDWRKLRSYIQFQNGGQNTGPWKDDECVYVITQMFENY